MTTPDQNETPTTRNTVIRHIFAIDPVDAMNEDIKTTPCCHAVSLINRRIGRTNKGICVNCGGYMSEATTPLMVILFSF